MRIIPFAVMARVRTLATIALCVLGGIVIGFAVGAHHGEQLGLNECGASAWLPANPIEIGSVTTSTADRWKNIGAIEHDWTGAQLGVTTALPVSISDGPEQLVSGAKVLPYDGKLSVKCNAGCLAVYRKASDGKTLLPDPDATPGETRLDSAAMVCRVKWGRDERHVTQKMKLQVCAAYGIAAKDCNGKNYEIDHLIPRELGGADTIANLWPQPIAQARLKDRLENRLHVLTCSAPNKSSAYLKSAQDAAAGDWSELYAKYFGGNDAR